MKNKKYGKIIICLIYFLYIPTSATADEADDSTTRCRELPYIYTEKLGNGRKKLGWNEESEPRLIHEGDWPMECREILKSCTVLMSGICDFDLFEWRAIRMKTTLYSSERWFKPILLSWPFAGIAFC